MTKITTNNKFFLIVIKEPTLKKLDGISFRIYNEEEYNNVLKRNDLIFKKLHKEAKVAIIETDCHQFVIKNRDDFNNVFYVKELNQGDFDRFIDYCKEFLLLDYTKDVSTIIQGSSVANFDLDNIDLVDEDEEEDLIDNDFDDLGIHSSYEELTGQIFPSSVDTLTENDFQFLKDDEF